MTQNNGKANQNDYTKSQLSFLGEHSPNPNPNPNHRTSQHHTCLDVKEPLGAKRVYNKGRLKRQVVPSYANLEYILLWPSLMFKLILILEIYHYFLKL